MPGRIRRMNEQTERRRAISDIPGIVVRCIVFFVFIFLTAAFQSSFFGAAGFFGSVPDLVLCAVLAVAISDGEKSGAICGIAGGVLTGAMGGGGTAFLPLFYCLIGYFAGYIASRTIRKNLISWTVYIVPAAFLRMCYGALYMAVAGDQAHFGRILSSMLLPEFVLTVVFSYLIYFVSFIVMLPLRSGRDRRGKTENE